MTDDLACTLLLHQYGALAIWDYTYAAPYIKIDMNSVPPGTHDKLFCKDAIIFSMHTFVGGTQTAGKFFKNYCHGDKFLQIRCGA